MTFQAPTMGYAVQLGMNNNATSTAVAATEKYELISESLASQRNILNTAGMRGSRSQVLERIRQGTIAPGGTLTLEPTPNELRNLMPRILGGTEGGNSTLYTYAVAATVPYFQTIIDRGAKVYTYVGCKVDRAVFRAGQGGMLQLELSIEALNEALGNSGTFASLSIDSNAPFTLFDGTLTLNGTAVQMMDVELTIDNALKKDRFVNSQTRTDLPEEDRVVTIKCTVPYTSDTVGLYDVGASGITCDLKFAVGGAGEGASGTSLRFVLQKVVFPANKSPTVASKREEIPLVLTGQVYMTAGTDEIAAHVDVAA
jgi:hypothetical protein